MKHSWQAERGVVAVEMSIVLLLGVVLLAAVVLMGRLTWHVVAMQKAVSSAGRIVGSLSLETLTTENVDGDITGLAANHIRAATRSAGLDIQPSEIEVDCVTTGAGGCGRTSVTHVSISAYMRFRDTIFSPELTGQIFPESDLDVTYFQIYVP